MRVTTICCPLEQAQTARGTMTLTHSMRPVVFVHSMRGLPRSTVRLMKANTLEGVPTDAQAPYRARFNVLDE